jgi:hypothetical protein
MEHRKLLGGFVLVWLSACGGSTTTPKSAGPSESGDQQPSTTAPTAEPTPTSSEATTPASGDELPSAPAATNVGFDFHGWCYDHGVEANLPVDECEPSGFGKAPADAIWCARHEDAADGVASYFTALYVVRAKKLVRVIEIPTAAGTIEEVGHKRGDSDRIKVKLSRENSGDGKTVTFNEDPKLDCAHAAEEIKDVAIADPKLGAKLGLAVQKVCATRGRYAWNGAALTKVSSKP